MEKRSEFLKRVLQRLPQPPYTTYQFESWSAPGKPTQEGFGLLPVPGTDPEKVIQRVMDVDHYTGNIEHVDECRAVADDRFALPEQVRFYQRVRIPMLGKVHHELVLTDAGEIEGFRVAFWEMLEPETEALDPKVGFRSQFNEGVWLAQEGVAGYALSSAPRRDDVGFLKWKALTKGADATASSVIKANIEGMCRWAQKA